MTKTLNQIIFFFSTKIRIFFSAKLGIRIFFYENIKVVKQGAPSLSKENVLKEFADVFEGTGKLQGKHHLELDENAIPTVHPPRKVPVAIKERLRNELERLTKMDIIKPQY